MDIYLEAKSDRLAKTPEAETIRDYHTERNKNGDASSLYITND